MTSIIRVFDHFGKFLTTLEGIPTTPRGWVMNKYGTCDFSISLDEAKCTEQNLQFGNLLYIEHIPKADESGNMGGQLPSWVGIILPPRTWTDKICQVTAYSAETILAYRALPYLSISGAPDEMFKRIIDEANKRAPDLPQIQLGQIDPVRVLTYEDDLRTNAYDHINKLVTAVGTRWNISGQINADASALALVANFSMANPIAGLTAKPYSLTTTNTEMQNPLLTEQGAPINHIFAYSQASTDAAREMRETLYPDSVALYGEFQLNATYIGTRSATGLTSLAENRTASGDGMVKKLFKRVALNVSRTFDYLRIGSILMVSEPRVGFNSNGGFGFNSLIRVISMDYNDLSDKVNLNVEVIQ